MANTKKAATVAKPAAQRRRTGRMMNTAKKSNAITQSNTTQSPLLALPPEIRNRIYTLVLGGGTIHVRLTRDTIWGKAAARKIGVSVCVAELSDDEAAEIIRYGEGPVEIKDYSLRHAKCGYGNIRANEQPNNYSVALPRTCKQVHSEAALLPFRTNAFSFLTKADFTTLLRKLIPIQQKAIGSLALPSTALDHDIWSSSILGLTGVKSLTGLKKLTIFHGVYNTEYGKCKQDSKDLCRVLSRKLSVFERLSLKSVMVCIYRYEVDRFNKKKTPTMDPELFNRLCEELEAKFLRMESSDKEQSIAEQSTAEQIVKQKENQSGEQEEK